MSFSINVLLVERCQTGEYDPDSSFGDTDEDEDEDVMELLSER